MHKIATFLQKTILRFDFILLLYVVVTAIATLILFQLPTTDNRTEHFNFSHYNNYVIFRNSFYHLVSYKDIYAWWMEEKQWDLYKYSPAFALFFGLFAQFPDWLGCTLWNVLNAGLLVYAFKKLPQIDNRAKQFMLLFIFFEMVTSVQNIQSNCLITALILLAFSQFEKGNPLWASLFICLTVFIKLFGMAAFVLFLFYPSKTRFILYSLLWTVILFLIPLLVVSPTQLIFLYKSWWNMLANDHTSSDGFSVMAWLRVWFGWNVNKLAVVFVGLLVLLLPLLRFKAWKAFHFRLYYLASVLIWVIIFNHKAESATFIIASSGVALWFFSSPKSHLNILLAILVLVFTILSPTDLFPAYLRTHYVIPCLLKVFPCILVWLKLQYDLNNFPLEEKTSL